MKIPLPRRVATSIVLAVGLLTTAPSGLRSAPLQDPQVPPPVQTPGGACIAIVVPSVAGVEGSATTIAVAVRDLFASYLTGPRMHSIGLEARLPSEAFPEARLKQCDNVLTSTIVHKRKGGHGVVGQLVGQSLGVAAYQIPLAGTITGAVVQGVAVAGAQAVSNLAATTKARDEIRFEYRVASADGRSTLGPISDKARATVDGEDLLTPLVERAATAIAARITRR